MSKRSTVDAGSGALLAIVGLTVITALAVMPFGLRSEAAKGLFVQTTSADARIPKMWDIREAKGDQYADALARFRQTVGRTVDSVRDIREGFARGEELLRQRHPDAKVEYNTDIRTPEVITPDVHKARIQWLTPPSTAKRTDILRAFLMQNADLTRLDDLQVDDLKVTADYTNPDGNLSYVHLEQFINDIPVFRGEVKAGFTKRGEMVRVINNLAPGLEYATLSTRFGDAENAVRKASEHLNHELRDEDVARNDAASNDLKTVFGSGDWATTAEKMYFPTEPGVAVPAWRVLIWRPVNAYYVIVDANSDVVLWHKNITDDQTQSATYNIYANPASRINAADHAAALSPYLSNPANDPTIGAQGLLGTRTNISLIGIEGPLSFNNNGWITDGANITDGNANEAGVDRVTPNGVDAAIAGDGACPGANCRVFSSSWNPPPGSPGPGDDPLTAQAQRGASIQMFYIMNRYHDELYLRGFNEAARNFQHDNFGRNPGGGNANAIAGVDRVSSEGQDSSGTNNANFSTPADGTRGRMQMYLWSGPTPDRDGTADADIVIHEVTHGTSNRIHGNGSGLGNQGSMMGEGWGDWYAHTLLAEPTDDPNGTSGLGGYSLFQAGGTMTSNYYYGIRRFPTALIASTGGPNRPACNNGPCPHNPLTFGHINSDCNATLGTTTTAVTSAFPRNPNFATTSACSQVHAAGEIWKSTLWEVRALLIARLGFAAGTTRALQVVTDGMKLSPINPTFLQERDGIIAAAAALSGTEASADVVDVREGFRRRGMGFSASVQSSSAVTQAFDFPNAAVINPITFTDAVPGGNNNGFAEPGETIQLSVPVGNATGTVITNVVVKATGGGSANYGSVADGATVTRIIPYTVSAGAGCGNSVVVGLTLSSDAGPQSPVNKSIALGQPQVGLTQNFDSQTAPTLPAGWTTAVTGSGVAWVTSATTPDTAPNAAFTSDPSTSASSELVTTNIPITSAASQVQFRLDYNTESGWDGMVLEIAIGAGAFQDILAAGGSFVQGGYTGALGTSTNPIGGRQAWNGNSSGYVTVIANLPAAANGQNVRLKFRFGADSSVAGVGVRVDGLQVVTEFTCSTPAPRSRSDFDGDGRTDLAVFRPSTGVWHLNRSVEGLAGYAWGASGDTIVPGDWDGDGKADPAVYRPTDTVGAADFFVLNSNGFTFTGLEWGVTGDLGVTGDWDGDGRADAAVFRPSNGTWYIRHANGSVRVDAFGQNGDIPMAIDHDGDGKTNLAVYRSSDNRWYIARATGVPGQNFDTIAWGLSSDVKVQADYDGDSKDDIAVFRPSSGEWFIIMSATGQVTGLIFGQNGDVPVPGDYDGDGRDDLAVYRGGTWYVDRSTAGSLVVPFGVASDIPVPKGYLP